MFNTIGIITKPQDFTSEETAHELSVFLNEQGVSLVEGSEQISKNADLIIVLGVMEAYSIPPGHTLIAIFQFWELI